MEEKKIELPELRILQKAGGVMRSRPARWDVLDIPRELLQDWKEYLHAKERFIATMAKFGIDTETMK